MCESKLKIAEIVLLSLRNIEKELVLRINDFWQIDIKAGIVSFLADVLLIADSYLDNA